MWHEYSGGARRPCARARSPPGSRRVRDRAAALDDRGAAGVLAARLRAGVTSFPIARLRYTATTKSWTLYWRDRSLRFHVYHRLAPSPSVDAPLAEIERDPTCIFWGEP